MKVVIGSLIGIALAYAKNQLGDTAEMIYIVKTPALKHRAILLGKAAGILVVTRYSSDRPAADRHVRLFDEALQGAEVRQRVLWIEGERTHCTTDIPALPHLLHELNLVLVAAGLGQIKKHTGFTYADINGELKSRLLDANPHLEIVGA